MNLIIHNNITIHKILIHKTKQNKSHNFLIPTHTTTNKHPRKNRERHNINNNTNNNISNNKLPHHNTN